MKYMTRPTVTPLDIEQALPIFVFGTLRPGNGNSARWRGLAEDAFDGKAILRDHRLVTNGAFPYCLPCTGEATTGTLIVPNIRDYPECLSNMDMLEGVPHHYDRKPCMVETPNAIIMAWYYLPNDWRGYERLDSVPNNDWSDRQPRARGNIAWWDR